MRTGCFPRSLTGRAPLNIHWMTIQKRIGLDGSSSVIQQSPSWFNKNSQLDIQSYF